MTDQTTNQRKKGRSPSYPGLDLESAVNRVRDFYRREHQHPTPADTVSQHWGYSAKSSGALTAIAALKKFGLVTDEGSGSTRLLKVTDSAVTILEHPDDVARREALRSAALAPPIHAEMWQRYGPNLPSDSNLMWDLERNRAFTPTGAAEFIANYRATLSYAGLDKGDTIIPDESDGDAAHDQEQIDRNETANLDGDAATRRSERKRQPGVVAITVPVPGFAADQPAVVEFPGKLSESEWAYFIGVLTAMKAGVIKPDESAGDD